MATRASVLAWRIPWMEEPAGLQSMGPQTQTLLKWLSMQAYPYMKHPWYRHRDMMHTHHICTHIYMCTHIYTIYICVCAQSLSRVWLFVTPRTVAHQAPLSIGFLSQEYWNGLPFLPPGDLPDPGIEPASLASPALAGVFFTTAPPGKPIYHVCVCVYVWTSLVTQTVKNLPAMWGTWVRSLGWKDPLEKGTATHSSILAWRIPWREEPGRL